MFSSQFSLNSSTDLEKHLERMHVFLESQCAACLCFLSLVVKFVLTPAIHTYEECSQMREYVHRLRAPTEGKHLRTHSDTNTQTQQDPTQPLYQVTLEGHVAL